MQALIMDFGGVISRTMFETHPMTEAALGLPAGTLSWRGPFDPASDPLWRDMLADKLTERDYWWYRTQEVAKLVGAGWTEMSDFVRAARGAEPDAVIRPEALDAIARVRAAELKLAVLSNELDLFYGETFRERLAVLDDFDAIVDATHTGILKPDPQAYELCCAALDVAPRDCVFVDDQPRNLRGAESAGMIAVPFDVRDPRTSFNAALRAMGLPEGEGA